MRSFTRGPADDIPVLPAAPEGETVALPPDLPSLPPHVRLSRRPEIGTRRVGDDLFLADAATRRIHRLNATGGIVWSLLAEPTTAEDLAAALRNLFPDVPAERLGGDLAALLSALRADQLIEAEGQD